MGRRTIKDETIEAVDELDDEELDKKNIPKWKKHYRKGYSISWEMDPNFRDWLAPFPSDILRATCKYCLCSIRAHRTDLTKHLASNKHKKNEVNAKNMGSYSKRTQFIVTQNLKQEQMSDHDNSAFGLIDGHGKFIPFTDNLDPDNVTDSEIKETVNKVGEAFCRDLLRLLRQKKHLVLGLQGSDFNQGENGIDRMTRILVAHLAQHYLIESTLDSWSKGGVMIDHMVNKMTQVEEHMEKYVLEVRNMKMQLECESGRGPAGVTLDTMDIPELQPSSATINIIGS